ncbi:hypothetical protein BT93_F3332 [Corymbia citriodora subsp. variegata]|nr:hypothetical protein BT93_F3332 [Corymbia citriodora subsp. variegata]
MTMAATSTSSMAFLPSTSSLAREPVNCWMVTPNKSNFRKKAIPVVHPHAHPQNNEEHADIVKPAQNMNCGNGTMLLPKRRTIEPPPFRDLLLSKMSWVVAASKSKWTRPYDNIRQSKITLDPCGGKMVQGGLVFRQSFLIRSYEIGTDSRATIETIMNYLQETKLNHFRAVGLLDQGFGSTPEMTKRNLVWVLRKMHVVVDDYPRWNDAIEVDTWIFPLGRDGQRQEWFIRDLKTRKPIAKATSVFVLMDKETRRLPKFLEIMRRESEAHAMKGDPIVPVENTKLRRLDAERADHVRTGLAPRWRDLDVNRHVNNTKFINWIVEVIPQSILESHELHDVNIEFRRECGKDSSLRSLSTEVRDDLGDGEAKEGIEFDHLLLLEDGSEIARARTKWRPRHSGIATD